MKGTYLSAFFGKIVARDQINKKLNSRFQYKLRVTPPQNIEKLFGARISYGRDLLFPGNSIGDSNARWFWNHHREEFTILSSSFCLFYSIPIRYISTPPFSEHISCSKMVAKKLVILRSNSEPSSIPLSGHSRGRFCACRIIFDWPRVVVRFVLWEDFGTIFVW